MTMKKKDVSEENNENRKKKNPQDRFKDGSRPIGWDKLDNTANIFPVVAGEELTNVYRISVTLTEEIKPDILQEALDTLLPKYGPFNLRLRHGLFWYYFEENGKPAPRVLPETQCPCRYIRENRNNSYLFRVTYYQKRINVEVSHVLTDGMGGFTFTKELAYHYLRRVHPEIMEEKGDYLDAGTSLNREDSFLKYYSKKKKGTAYGVKLAFPIHGEKLPKGEFGVCHVYIPLPEIKAYSKKMEVSLNDVLVADFIYSIYREQWKSSRKKWPIRINVPVNLRPYFNSETSKNFFVMTSIEFQPEKEDYTFEEVLTIVHEDVKRKVTKENLEVTMSYNVGMGQNRVARFVPLQLKNQGMLWAYRFISHSNTSTVTNVGIIKVDEAYQPYIEAFHAFLALSMGQLMKGTICTYNNRVTYTFSTLYQDASIERRFVRTLSELGIPVSVETNGLYR